jgi:bud site selection protein 20
VQRASRTRARAKDLDQIHDDLKPEALAKLHGTMTEYDPNLPGGG